MRYSEYAKHRDEYESKKAHDQDPIVNTVIQRMKDRSAEGMEKYGCTMLRDDLSTSKWIDHAIEELLDAAIYLERIKHDIQIDA